MKQIRIKKTKPGQGRMIFTLTISLYHMTFKTFGSKYVHKIRAREVLNSVLERNGNAKNVNILSKFQNERNSKNKVLFV